MINDSTTKPRGRLSIAVMWKGVCPVALSVGLALQPGSAWAQRATESAVAAADDAFGGTVGRESAGIYSEADIRGFSPQKAGNGRIEGVYFDQVAPLAGVLKTGSSMRVGFAAIDYPFPAPTGIVDSRLRTAGNELRRSAAVELLPYYGSLAEFNFEAPIVKDRLGVAGGLSATHNQFTDGATSNVYAFAVRPRIRLPRLEVSPFYSVSYTRDALARPITTTSGPYLPNILPPDAYVGQDWTNSESDNYNLGATARANLGAGFSLRGGAFRSRTDKIKNFVEINAVTDAEGHANHIVVADPPQDSYSDSWEGQLAWNGEQDNLHHRVIMGVRGRTRHTETGGSDRRNFGQVIVGVADPQPPQMFTFTPVSVGTIEQTNVMVGYIGSLKNVGEINVGLQRANYEASQASPIGVTSSSSEPWLYSAALRLDPFETISVFAGYARGLEDSGTAPESAANRNEQMPATETEQLDSGVRFKLPVGQLVASVFQITKPYFTFDTTNTFGQFGTVRHRGVEFSFSGSPTERLQLLAGAVLLDAEVSGSVVDTGQAGERAAGTPAVNARIDANYRTDVWGGLTPTLSVVHQGERAASAAPYAELGGEQLMLPARTVVDIGARYTFNVGETALSLRATVGNIFDDASWRVLGANTLGVEDRRKFSMALLADF